MLVLTRKLMEQLYIGDDICVTVVRLEGGQVRLGIDAPRHVRVVRAELDRLPATRSRSATDPGAQALPATPVGERTPPAQSLAARRSRRRSSRSDRGPFSAPQSPGS